MLKIRFVKSWPKGAWEIFAVDQGERKHTSYKITIEAKTTEESFQIEPAMDVPWHQMESFLPALIEGLSEAGFLAKSPGDIAQLEAVKYHLEDMRKLVFTEKDDGGYL